MFGVGYIKTAPGTFASLITCVVYYINFYIIKTDYILLYFIILILFCYSFVAINNIKEHFKSHDPKEIVVDEFFGQLIPLFVVEYFLYYFIDPYAITESGGILRFEIHFLGEPYTQIFCIIVAFLLFRIFDILKPFPINLIDKKYKNTFGIIFDDIIAGIFAAVIIAIPLYYLSLS